MVVRGWRGMREKWGKLICQTSSNPLLDILSPVKWAKKQDRMIHLEYNMRAFLKKSRVYRVCCQSCYCSPMKQREDNVFSRVCLSLEGGSPCDNYPWCIEIHHSGMLLLNKLFLWIFFMLILLFCNIGVNITNNKIIFMSFLYIRDWHFLRDEWYEKSIVFWLFVLQIHEFQLVRRGKEQWNADLD